jgi:hypothetical protein
VLRGLLARAARRRRGRAAPRAMDQWRALSAMGELCPGGWQAQITLTGEGGPLAPDAPPARVPPVALEWTRFDERSGQALAARRVWARSIGGALQAMIDDRATDVALERGERETWQL